MVTDQEWISFKEMAPETSWLWITDKETVWLRHIAYLEDTDRELWWAEAKIEYPPVPKKWNFYKLNKGCK